ncbi:histidine kinase [Paenibacillus frigoriresistens]|uniref:sensor histidine kinase n=1 Tax=Paenibacillus alginolyticus TaxID=59839 RepID=UPI001565A155|nr:histidine kinase [Paenibacillus frigoriresistens]NRF93776.1 histidine kinase [Paenibacillus frigoriresistens]
MKLITKCFRFAIEPFQRSIRNQLIATLILLVSIPLVAITLLASENTRTSVETEVIESNMSKIKWTGGYLEERLDQINNIVYTLLINESYNDYLRKMEDSNPSIAFNAQKGLLNIISSIFYSNVNYLSDIQMYVNEPNKFFLASGSNIEVTSPKHVPELFQGFFSTNDDFMITNRTNGQSFYLIRSVNRFEDRKRLGGISLEINWGNMDSTLELLNPGDEQALFITNQNEDILYQLGGDLSLKNSFVMFHQPIDSGSGYYRTKDHYIFYSTIQPWGLKLFKVIPNSFINDSSKRTWSYGIAIGIISIALSIFIAIIVAWKTSKPIVKLARSMQGLVPPKEYKMPVITRKDEIGLLETRYYHMSIRLKEYIKTEYSMNLEKRTAQLKALQAQVNPHFLQNTLQLIGSMAFAKSPGELYDVIRSLSEMFRYVIRDQDELTTIQKELDHVHNYLHIQKQRFTSRISSKVDLEHGLEDTPIPKLILQPIVENAFVHGLDKKIGVWEIHITVRQNARGVSITIEDNGIGIEPHRLEALQQRLTEQSDKLWERDERIGLNNVAARIRMHFGQPYGIVVESRLGMGTAIRLQLPMKEEVAHD